MITQAELVLLKLRELILNGEFLPGSHLMEVSLSEQRPCIYPACLRSSDLVRLLALMVIREVGAYLKYGLRTRRA